MSSEQYHTTIGALLQSARASKRLTLEQASRSLHIRAHYLEALEQGKLEEMPGLAYTRGYLQGYAAYLGLDKEEILRRFELLEALMEKRAFYFPHVFSKEKKPGSWPIWGGLSAMLLIYMAWYLLFSPNYAPISVVDANPPPPMARSFPMPLDVACLQRAQALYPPCTSGAMKTVSSLPSGWSDSYPWLHH